MAHLQHRQMMLALGWINDQLRVSLEHLTLVARFSEEHPESQCFKNQEEVRARLMKVSIQK